MVKEIPLQNGMVALVDDEDYENVSKYNWVLHKNAKTSYNIHTRMHNLTRETTKTIRLSHFILGEIPEKMVIFQKNRNFLDFRKANLILLTRSELMLTAKGKTGSSKYKGVSWSKRDKAWIVQTHINGESKYLGSFSNEDKAAKHYNDEILRLAPSKMKNLVFLNKIGKDNSAHELEDVKRSSTQFRRHKSSTSQYKGVRLERKSGGYVSFIYNDGKEKYLGYFNCQIEAAKVYDKKAKELFGEKAILNFS